MGVARLHGENAVGPNDATVASPSWPRRAWGRRVFNTS
jgi:hypothetical protein